MKVKTTLALSLSLAALGACKTTGNEGTDSALLEGAPPAQPGVDPQVHQQCDFAGKQAAQQFVLPAKKKQAYEAAYKQCLAQHGGGGGNNGGGDGGGELPLVNARTKKAATKLQGHLQQVPPVVLQNAQCIAEVSKDNIGWGLGGGELGAGLVSCRTATGQWSAPSYLSLVGVSIGPNIGFLNDDTTFIFTKASANDIWESKFTFDAGVHAVAGNAFAEASADTDGCLKVKVLNQFKRQCTLAISDISGLQAGANVSGVVLRHMNGVFGGGNVGRNAKVYGGGISTEAILTMPGSQAPAVTQSWVQVLNQFAP